MKDLVETRYYYFLHTKAFYHVKTQWSKLLSSKKTWLYHILGFLMPWTEIFSFETIGNESARLRYFVQQQHQAMYSSWKPHTCQFTMSLGLILLWPKVALMQHPLPSLFLLLSPIFESHLTCPYLQHIDTKSWYPVLKFHTAVKLIPTSSFWFAFNKTHKSGYS